MAKEEVNICISTNIFEHPLWRSDKLSRFEAWLYLLNEANLKDSKHYAGNQVVEIKRGQLAVTLAVLADSFGWTIKRVRNFLDLLENDKRIKKGTEKGTKKTLITICDFDNYIFENKERAQERAQEGHDVLDPPLPPQPPVKPPKKTKEEIKAEREKRAKVFYKSLIPFVDIYGKDMIRAFYDYWVEPNKSGTRMRFEMEKTWETSKRLGTWERNNFNGKHKEPESRGFKVHPAISN